MSEATLQFSGNLIEGLIGTVERAEQQAALTSQEPAHPFNPDHWKTCTRPWCRDLYMQHVLESDVYAQHVSKEPCDFFIQLGTDPAAGEVCRADGHYCPKCEVVHCSEHAQC